MVKHTQIIDTRIVWVCLTILWLSVFDHFVKLALKRLTIKLSSESRVIKSEMKKETSLQNNFILISNAFSLTFLVDELVSLQLVFPEHSHKHRIWSYLKTFF